MTYEQLEDALDMAQRAVYELQEELREYDEDSQQWNLCYEDLCDAENEVDYLQERIGTWE